MKKLLNTITILSAISTIVYAQVPNWEWAKGVAGGTGFGTSTDNFGNVYVTGRYFSNTINFGAITLTNSGNSDIFIVKYDASGNVLWANGGGGDGLDDGVSVATDAIGNVYLVGNFRSDTITFGTNLLINSDTGGSTLDIFIVKYDVSGNLLWAKSIGNIEDDYPRSCITDLNGNLYLTGDYRSDSITFDTTTLINLSTQSYTHDFFIAKYSSFGNVLWAKSHGSVGNDGSYCLTKDSTNGIYITGFFTNSINFGATTLNGLGSPYSSDIFIAKYDSSGNVDWAIREGGMNSDFGMSISCDYSGNLFICGIYQSDTISFVDTTLLCSGINDVFVAKYDSFGNIIWVTGINGSDWEYGYSCANDIFGNVYIIGNFDSPSISFGNYNLYNPNGDDQMFIAKYNTFGDLIWAESLGNYGYDVGFHLSSNALGSVYLTGRFDFNITFGPTIINSQGTNMFIAKIDANIVNIEDNFTDNNIVLFPNPGEGMFMFKDHKNIKTVEVFNMMGELILSQGSAKQINLQAFPKGIYVARINGAYVTRLVKE